MPDIIIEILDKEIQKATEHLQSLKDARQKYIDSKDIDVTFEVVKPN